jgi:aerobic carbon-monoxide dehydrogenase small subunit
VAVEGLKQNVKLHPLQESFMGKGAVQCGFCTPDMILTAKVLIERNEKPTRKEMGKAMSSNACRCAGCKKIIDAAEGAAKMAQ